MARSKTAAPAASTDDELSAADGVAPKRGKIRTTARVATAPVRVTAKGVKGTAKAGVTTGKLASKPIRWAFLLVRRIVLTAADITFAVWKVTAKIVGTIVGIVRTIVMTAVKVVLGVCKGALKAVGIAYKTGNKAGKAKAKVDVAVDKVTDTAKNATKRAA